MPSELHPAPPRTWRGFEDLCCDLWRGIWNDPVARKHGRRDARQPGVDVFGRLAGGSKWQGIRCHDRGPAHRLEPREALAEVEAARHFEPQLDSLILATRASNELASPARRAIQVTEQDFDVEVFSWDDILTELRNHSELIRQHYPDAADLSGAPHAPRGSAASDGHVDRCPVCETVLDGAHVMNRRCYVTWSRRRKKLLLAFAVDRDAYVAEALAADPSGWKADVEADADLLAEIVRSFSTDREEEAGRLIQAWFQPFGVLPEDESSIVEELQSILDLRPTLEEELVAAQSSEPVGRNVYALLHDPMIAEHGALPASRDAGEWPSLLAEAWIDVAADVVPGYDESRVREAFRADVADQSPSSLEAEIYRELRRDIDRVLKTLTQREEFLLVTCFGLREEAEHTVEEIARMVNVTPARIHQIKGMALRKLRHPSRASVLRPHFDP